MTTAEYFFEFVVASLGKEIELYRRMADSMDKYDYGQIFKDYAEQIGVDELTREQKKVAFLNHILAEGAG